VSSHHHPSSTAFVTANGLRFAYLDQGRGPLLLFVHGFPDTAYTWEHAMPEIARTGVRVVAPFTRGYFPTAIPPDARYDCETLARDLLALIEALGERHAILVGHDWGALAAYAAAALAPQSIRLLITVACPHPRAIRLTPAMLWKARHLLFLRRASAAARIRRGGFAYIDELVRRASPAWHAIPADETMRVKQAFSQPGCLEAACAYYKTLSPRLPDALRAPIAVPTVAFAGEHDVLRPHHYELARPWFQGRYEIIRVPGGHFLHREHPAPFHHELVRVVGELA
jgi:pimeloyl-ACP methyl ester carboxylesterase